MNHPQASKKQTQTKPIQTQFKACPERSEFTLSVIEGNGSISSKAEMNLKSLAKKSGHTLLWIYLSLFLTPPGQTVRILASDFESALLSLRKEFTWRL